MFPKALRIEKKLDTPGITFDKDMLLFDINGRSFPEHSGVFFAPVLQWLKDYKATKPTNVTELRLRFEYLNTSSSKLLLEILHIFADIEKQSGTHLTVKWYYPGKDESIFAAGQEFEEISGLRFRYVRSK
ncbi:MAG: nuclear pore complex subunit [Bacteroidia bacterium]|nr:MAG: nuclear pore complex subunit [Bacteroidia bacterium]